MKKLTKDNTFSIIGRVTKFIILMSLLLIMSGCASIPSTSISRDEIPTLSEKKGRIIFYRTSFLFGSGMKPPIFLNGKKVGISSSGTAFYVDVDPGRHKVSVEKILYPGSEGGVDFVMHENKIVYVRTWTGGSAFIGRTNAEVVNPSRAEEDLKEVTFLRYHLKQ